MTKVTKIAGSAESEWNGVLFKRGEAVELDETMPAHAFIIEKAVTNRFYEVGGITASGLDVSVPGPDDGVTLREQLKSLGVKVPGRASDEWMRAKLEDMANG